MSYTGKKPVDVVDATTAQTLEVSTALEVDTIKDTSGTNAIEIDSSGNVTLSQFGQGAFIKNGTVTITPRDDSSPTGGNASSTTETAHWTKIGNIVFVEVSFSNINTTGMTAANPVYFHGLPYARKDGTISVGAVRYDSIDPSDSRPYITSWVASKYFYLAASDATRNDTPVDVRDFTDDVADFHASFFYFTDDDA